MRQVLAVTSQIYRSYLTLEGPRFKSLLGHISNLETGWLPCQMTGGMGSVLGLICLVSVLWSWVRYGKLDQQLLSLCGSTNTVSNQIPLLEVLCMFQPINKHSFQPLTSVVLLCCCCCCHRVFFLGPLAWELTENFFRNLWDHVYMCQESELAKVNQPIKQATWQWADSIPKYVG